ncbi:MAG: response regulator [Gemmatimonadota bacterium]
MNARHSHRVMFVDDEEGVRAAWNRYLAERGFDVTLVEDGAKAVRQLERESPVDVVVADLRMPGLDGLQLLEWVHEERPETPFILLTGYGNDEVERRARELGVYEYLNKPISPEELSAVITAASQLAHAPRVRGEVSASSATAVAPEAGATPVERLDGSPGGRAAASRPERGRFRTALETAGALVSAPVLGLAFVVFLPLVGFVALAWSLGERVVSGKASST